ncbi:MAG: carbamoyltransferase [Gemmatimonadetes bacterium]|jgi:carbamoyltransferase|nr:carbamoyltransferase [Gemmatimonadota bacterium]MBT6902717.1 carbamoyltransferase [Gemmatimonadota bacterium]MBT7549606.1 carbamoyltransferase [Gemmatimonadota bacterium]MBT7585369.1 carbamoyltransferase [Gemmatimonadota bacterium]
MPTYILGISAFYHDSAACLIRDGEIVAAAQEERFTRVKHDPGFPGNAARYCLQEAGIEVKDLHCVGFYDKPLMTFERLLETHLGTAPLGIRLYWKSMVVWLKEKLWIPQLIQKELGYDVPVLFGDHHESHAASAFYPSPYEEAAIMTLDGVGEWTTTSYGYGRGSEIHTLADIKFPHSLGLLYSAFTYFTGFKVNSGEYKLMGLAPYGEPKYVDRILDNVIDLKEDGSFKLNTRYFNYISGLTMTSPAMGELFGGPPRQPETPLTQREMDIARSCQVVTEEVMLRIARTVHKETGLKNLCMAGGVALNCVGNGRVLRDGPFENIWIQPAAGDAGGALGVALALWYHHLGNERVVDGEKDAMRASLLGPVYDDDEIGRFIEGQGGVAQKLSEDELPVRVAEQLAAGKVMGFFQGRMEFGPRALGARSIIGDPRSTETQSVMNLKIKFRESFRPFAPTVLREHVHEYFELDTDSPYMLQVAPIKEERQVAMSEDQEQLFGIEKLNVPRSDMPAVTHVDYSARVQTLRREDNPRYYDVIKAFQSLTGYPVVVNTSFNVRGEPIVLSPEDAYRCFMRTEMDFLVLGSYLLDKQDQPQWHEEKDWREEFALD